MAEVQISYKGSAIAQMNASGTKTLLTEGKYLEDDVTVEYTRPSTPSPTLITKTITENGTYDASDDNADGYSEVTVNVSGGGGGVPAGEVIQDEDGYLVLSDEAGGGGGGANPLYPFGHYYVSVSGAAATLDVYQKASGGAHIKIQFGTVTLSSGAAYFNLTDGRMQTTATYINNRPLWFTIPSGKQCVLKYTNIVNAGGITFAVNFKLANSTTSTTEFSTGDGAWAGEKTINVTLSSAENIGCLFLYAPVRSANSNSVIEFDVSLTVDGVEYF